MRLLDAFESDPEVEAFFSDEADLAAMLRFEVALAEAQAEAGAGRRDAAVAIAAACRAFRPDWGGLAAGLARDGVVVPALVGQLRAQIGDPHAAALHRGVTSQDVIDTSLVLRLEMALAVLAHRLDAIRLSLAALAARDGARVLQAHTRMQVALPITAADKVASWTEPLARHATRLAELKPRLLRLQLGGPVGTRAELGPAADAIALGVAARLGLAPAPPWHAQRDAIVETGNWLALVMGTLGKLGQDVALLAQNEVAAVKLASGGTSSAMAHKQNPVGAEILVALARYGGGLGGTLQMASVHENERSGAAWTLEWLVLPKMVVSAAAAMRVASALIADLRFT